MLLQLFMQLRLLLLCLMLFRMRLGLQHPAIVQLSSLISAPAACTQHSIDCAAAV
jgi:hypothetical protein